MPSPLRTAAYLLYAIAALVAVLIVSMQFEPDSDVVLRELWWPLFVALAGAALHGYERLRAWHRRRRAGA